MAGTPVPRSLASEAPKTGSGEHPAVKAYREKLDSIVDGAEADVEQLNRTLATYLRSVKTPIPPPLPGGPMIECTATEWRDIGHGVSVQVRSLDGVPGGVAYRHPRPDGKGQCEGYAPLNPERPLAWDLVSLEPLTLSPSLLCLACQHHGYIENGRWRPC